MTQPAIYKIPRSQQRTFLLKLHKEQGGICPLCNQHINLAEKGAAVMDHCHESGQVRGILHRSCNAAEGKVANAAGRWGAKSMDYAAIVPWLEKLLAYLKKEPTEFIYPTHMTPDELRLKRNVAARKQRAQRKARQVVRPSA